MPYTHGSMEMELDKMGRNILRPLAACVLPWSGWYVSAGCSQLILKSERVGDAMEDRMVQIIPKRRGPALLPTFKRGMNVWQGDAEKLSQQPHEVAIYQKRLQAPKKPFGILEKYESVFLSERLAEVVRRGKTIGYCPPVRMPAVLGTFSKSALEPYTAEGNFEAYVPTPLDEDEEFPFVFLWETSSWLGCRRLILQDDVNNLADFPNPHETIAMVCYPGVDQDYEGNRIPLYSEACVKAMLEVDPDLVFSPVLLGKGSLLREAYEHEGAADRLYMSNDTENDLLELAKNAGVPDHEARNIFHNLLNEEEIEACIKFYKTLHPNNTQEMDWESFETLDY